jgi:hypothetical protein
MTELPPWKPTPKEEKFLVHRLRDGEWQQCEFEDLVRGDKFRLFHPKTGSRMNPATNNETEEQLVGLATSDAMRNYLTNQGYGLECEVEYEYGPN